MDKATGMLSGAFRSKGNFVVGTDGNRLAHIDGKLYIEGPIIKVADGETTIEDAIARQDERIKDVEDSDKSKPAVWAVEVYDVDRPLAPPLLEDKLQDYRTSATYAYKVYRSGVDVTEVIALSTTPLVSWSRVNPKGYDDDGLADREWEAAHRHDRQVTLTTRHINFECALTAIADSEELEQYYQSL